LRPATNSLLLAHPPDANTCPPIFFATAAGALCPRCMFFCPLFCESLKPVFAVLSTSDGAPFPYDDCFTWFFFTAFPLNPPREPSPGPELLLAVRLQVPLLFSPDLGLRLPFPCFFFPCSPVSDQYPDFFLLGPGSGISRLLVCFFTVYVFFLECPPGLIAGVATTDVFPNPRA